MSTILSDITNEYIHIRDKNKSFCSTEGWNKFHFDCVQVVTTELRNKVFERIKHYANKMEVSNKYIPDEYFVTVPNLVRDYAKPYPYELTEDSSGYLKYISILKRVEREITLWLGYEFQSQKKLISNYISSPWMFNTPVILESPLMNNAIYIDGNIIFLTAPDVVLKSIIPECRNMTPREGYSKYRNKYHSDGSKIMDLPSKNVRICNFPLGYFSRLRNYDNGNIWNCTERMEFTKDDNSVPYKIELFKKQLKKNHILNIKTITSKGSKI